MGNEWRNELSLRYTIMRGSRCWLGLLVQLGRTDKAALESSMANTCIWGENIVERSNAGDFGCNPRSSDQCEQFGWARTGKDWVSGNGNSRWQRDQSKECVSFVINERNWWVGCPDWRGREHSALELSSLGQNFALCKGHQHFYKVGLTSWNSEAKDVRAGGKVAAGGSYTSAVYQKWRQGARPRTERSWRQLRCDWGEAGDWLGRVC